MAKNQKKNWLIKMTKNRPNWAKTRKKKKWLQKNSKKSKEKKKLVGEMAKIERKWKTDWKMVKNQKKKTDWRKRRKIDQNGQKIERNEKMAKNLNKRKN